MEAAEQLSSSGVSLTPSNILERSAAITGQTSQPTLGVFNKAISSGSAWAISAGVFAIEAIYLSFQRFWKKSIDSETYRRRVASSFFSNVTGVVGGSAGAQIGFTVGNFFLPGIGSLIGTILGGVIGSVLSQYAVEKFMDPQSHSIEKYEELEVSDEEKKLSY